MFEFVIILILIIYTGFRNDGIAGIFESLNILLIIGKELLGFLNIFTVNIIGDGILTGFFLHYFVYTLVGVTFELFNIKRGYPGKLFGKIAYLIIGIPVSFILNYFSSIFFG